MPITGSVAEHKNVHGSAGFVVAVSTAVSNSLLS